MSDFAAPQVLKDCLPGMHVYVKAGNWKSATGVVLSVERDEVTVLHDKGGRFHTKIAYIELST